LIYSKPTPLDELEQGDILKKSEQLEQLLQTYHPYYASHPDNKFFVVLTQSCDLVIRNGECNARYISIAPVRPLKAILKREFEGKLDNVGPGCQPFAPRRVRTSVEQFLQRLFNNNEPPFFYFEAAHESGIYEEMCAMLALAISLKPEHHETLRASKLIGITDVFQAKLGWLLGQMYSRVGTPDFAPPDLAEKVKSYLEGVALWMEDAEFKRIRGLVDAKRAANPEAPVGTAELTKLLQQLPKRKDLLIDAVLEVAAAEKLIPPDRSPQRRALRLALERDPKFAAAFR
jgi:hypothetical protein